MDTGYNMQFVIIGGDADCSDAYHVVTGQKIWVPLSLRANRAGWAVADNVCGKETRLESVAGTAIFKLFNLEGVRTGLLFEESQHYGFEPVEVTIKSRSRAHPRAVSIRVDLIGYQKSGRLLFAQIDGKKS
jgi:CoA-dependent NAD(P)H sulfur oxidoreductase